MRSFRTHGNVMSALLDRLRRRGVKLGGRRHSGGGGKGSFWVLEGNGGDGWSRATYQPPPS